MDLALIKRLIWDDNPLQTLYEVLTGSVCRSTTIGI